MLKLFIIIALLVGMVSAGAYLLVKSPPPKQTPPPSTQPTSAPTPMERDKNISDTKLQEMISNCEIIGDYSYHNGEKGIVLKNNETLELKNKSDEEIKQLISSIPPKCGPERVKVIE